MFLSRARYESTGKAKWGRTNYVTRAELTFLAKDGERYVVPKGFHTDLASIPSWLTWLIPPSGSLWDDAAILHDWLCHLARQGEVTFAEADDIFYDALRDCGCPAITAFIFWSYVRGMHIVRGDG